MERLEPAWFGRGMGRFIGLALGVFALSSLLLSACVSSSSSSSSGGSGGTSGDGGTSGGGGSSGSGGVPGLTKSNAVDLLIVVDNSIGMADKQEVLADTATELVEAIVANPALGPIADLHVGVVSSSLGGHGGNVCPDDPGLNDRGHLLPDVRPGLPHAGQGFLVWQPGGNVQQLGADLAQNILGAGEQGCGFEAPLESWYRFLVDPNPPAQVAQQGGATVASGTDSTVLSQRAAFLRPDSLLAIVVLSDENDCSIRDSDVGWYVATITNPGGTPFPLAKPTSACASDPNSSCCRSCADTTSAPSGCANPDPACDGASLDPSTTDKINLRCWQQKRRFGIDFLYPTARYVNALRQKRICPTNPDLSEAECEGALADNPLFTNPTGGPARGSELVLFMGIVGVPWQDLATDATLGNPGSLAYLDSNELASQGRWDWITGDFTNPPADPHMVESSDPRTGTSPLGQSTAAPGSGAGANPINGHEWNAAATVQGDLQYACIHPLPTPRDCLAATGGCDCKPASGADPTFGNPLCQAPGSAPGQGYSTTQYFAKAYPGLRQIDVARGADTTGAVVSICPKLLEPGNPSNAYLPAIDLLVRTMQPRIGTP